MHKDKDGKIPKLYSTEQMLIEDTARRLSEFNEEDSWMVDTILEKGEHHMIVGPSGSGKSSFLIPLMKDINEGKLIFGKYASHPEKFLYVVADRSWSITKRTFERLGLGDFMKKVPWFTMDVMRRDRRQHGDLDPVTLPKLMQENLWAKYIFVDGIGAFEPSGRDDLRKTFDYFAEIRDAILETNQTVIGTYHPPKSKPGDKYLNPRDRIYGNVSKQGNLGCIIDIQFEDESHIEDTGRIFTVCPRSAKMFKLKYGIGENGTLEYVSKYDGKQEEDFKTLDTICEDMRVRGYQPGQVIHPQMVAEWVQTLKVNRVTVYRALKKLVQMGCMTRLESKGFYRLEEIPAL